MYERRQSRQVKKVTNLSNFAKSWGKINETQTFIDTGAFRALLSVIYQVPDSNRPPVRQLLTLVRPGEIWPVPGGWSVCHFQP